MSFLWPLLGSATGTSFPFCWLAFVLCFEKRADAGSNQTKERTSIFPISLSISKLSLAPSFQKEATSNSSSYFPIRSPSSSPQQQLLYGSVEIVIVITPVITCKEQALSFAQLSLSSKADLVVSSACCELGELFTLSLPLEKENCGVALRLHQRVHSS